MRKVILFALLLVSPAMAEPMQFDTVPAQPAARSPAMPPGLAWLSRQPVTLFDLGLMELSRQAGDALRSLSGITSAVAEYSQEDDTIAITFYPATDYTPPACEKFITSLREMMFPEYADPAQLAEHLSALFNNYGPPANGRPASLVKELMNRSALIVRLRGGYCIMKLTAEAPEQHEDASTSLMKNELPASEPKGKKP